ncbi:CCR4-NOT transcription complex subunit 4 [Cucurbita argyrosperma subsp. argyrosperma]|nr:CCR4-NOT transcription complex subunit 4 [Cucurbita argyrosperma subsp. argyrosperma]
MVTDSIANASISLAPSARDLPLSKKRRARNSKLKQSKLDVRREQWLSRGAIKNKKWSKEDNRLDSEVVKTVEDDKLPSKKINRRDIGEEDDRSVHHHSDCSESPSNSPPSIGSSILGGNDSGHHFTGSSSSSSCRSSSSGCRSGSITEEEEDEGDDDCLEDWEAFADTLIATDKQHDQCSESSPRGDVVSQLGSCGDSRNELGIGDGDSSIEHGRIARRASMNGRAWRPDDADRPQSLPTLSKQLSLPNTDRRFGCGGIPWACGGVMPVPTSCPICFEDLDLTDSNFLPCPCGFRLCLFCHKRILEEDGRCPGCRKPYDRDPADNETNEYSGSPTFPLARSCSMISRS